MITRTMVIGDAHILFHDKLSLNLILDIAEDIKIDRLILNGDIADFFCVNMHGPKHPDIITTLMDEMDAVREFLEKLRARFPNIEIVYNAGNHENRLDRFIIKYARPFWGILTCSKYFMVDNLNIQFNPYNFKYQIEETNCYVQHSPSSYASPLANLKKKLDQTFIFGCTHREGSAHLTGASGDVYSVYFNGWLGSVDETLEHRRVFEYTRGHENWQQSFCIVTSIDKKKFHINQYSIRDHRVVVDGVLYEA